MKDLTVALALLNDAAVSLFGGVLSLHFCGIGEDRRCRRLFWVGMALMLIPQGAVYLIWSAGFRLQVYPLILHLPLWVLLYFLTGKCLWPAVSILSAYLFCQPRRWLGLLAAALLPGGEFTRMLVELAVTLPLLFILLRFAVPSVCQLREYPVRTQVQFGLIPAVYYGFDYLSRIYTDLLSSGQPVVVEFMPTVCCIAYLVFVLHASSEERQRSMLQQARNSLNLQVLQASREIASLRESQNRAARYRHDLRHHLQFLLDRLESGQYDQARAYILDIRRELDVQRVRRYCENEAVNLILSAFAERAGELGVGLEIQGSLPAVMPVADNDMCVIFSNALENALHACLPFLEAGRACTIAVQFHYVDKNGKFFLRIENPCGDVAFNRQGIPVSGSGGGVGVRSICAITERYGGGVQFSAAKGQFVMRLFL